MAKFCEDCGASLGVASADSAKESSDPPIGVAETPVNENIDGERKTVTALFADIRGSTELEQGCRPQISGLGSCRLRSEVPGGLQEGRPVTTGS